VVTQGGGIGGAPIIAEDQARKREMRLLKNRWVMDVCTIGLIVKSNFIWTLHHSLLWPNMWNHSFIRGTILR